MQEADRTGTPAPPVAEARPASYTVHGITVEDPYRWPRDDNFPTVDDEAVLFHTVVDEHGRAFQVRRHVIGEPAASDQVVYEERDTRFFVGVAATASKDYVVIHSSDHETTEVYLIPAAEPFREPRVVSARRTGHEYHVDHQGDRFVIKTNDTHKNARLVTAPDDDPCESGWQTLVAGSDERYIRHFAAFADSSSCRNDWTDSIRSA